MCFRISKFKNYIFLYYIGQINLTNINSSDFDIDYLTKYYHFFKIKILNHNLIKKNFHLNIKNKTSEQKINIDLKELTENDFSKQQKFCLRKDNTLYIKILYIFLL